MTTSNPVPLVAFTAFLVIFGAWWVWRAALAMRENNKRFLDLTCEAPTYACAWDVRMGLAPRPTRLWGRSFRQRVFVTEGKDKDGRTGRWTVPGYCDASGVFRNLETDEPIEFALAWAPFPPPYRGAL